ncbi:uncharacterized protein TNIN_214301 [Trichonephila inaurata madagascariensis]|uniref:Gustatory receptor n=1 Tax=Trichonephila inaurata madagascariensis TaxID=2747483 RepID=A0A8X7BUL3_9ARAC|nr:uncharacterized protein TNIN_214301 [Trichonephila inaurata madagascariensis]
MVLPIGIFSTFYAVLCYHLYDVVKNFLKYLDETTINDNDVILKQYLSIRKLVLEADSELSLLMFMSSLFYACAMYFGIASILHSEDYTSSGSYLSLVTIWLVFIASNTAFVVMAIFGSLVWETSTDIWEKAQELMNTEQNPTFSQKRFLAVSEKGLTMTAWKITPVKRSFILATMGTIFTYCILLDTIAN